PDSFLNSRIATTTARRSLILRHIQLTIIFFFFNDTPTTDIYTLSLHDALPISLKPAIEACGISTLSQSPMLGFHKQMDNRIKLLEEILSFRMQGVEFDNGDMYVDGHKAASDVRDEFVSVTEKLMDELAQC